MINSTDSQLKYGRINHQPDAPLCSGRVGMVVKIASKVFRGDVDFGDWTFPNGII